MHSLCTLDVREGPAPIHPPQSIIPRVSSAFVSTRSYTVKMSRLSPNVRPIIPRGNSSTSSLNGMEIATPKFPPTPKSPYQNKKDRKNSEYHSVKPLPPTPAYPSLKLLSAASSRASSVASSRAPSTASLSSVYTEDIPPTPQYVPFRGDTMLTPPKAAYQPSTYRSSTSIVPDAPPLRPKLKQHAQTQEILQKPAAIKTGPPESLFSEWKAPKYEEKEDDEEPKSPVQIKLLAQKSREVPHIAEQHADDYRSLLPRHSRFNSVDSEPSYDFFKSLPGPMSPRITDVVDDSLLPQPLRMSIAFNSDTSSHYSSSPSELMPLGGEIGESFKARAKKAFHSRQFSQGKSANQGDDSKISSKSGKRNKVISMTPSERASIQKGIIDMYDTLASFYDPLNKYGPSTKLAQPPRSRPTVDVPPPDNNVLHKGHRSPAHPMTPYPSHGRKAEEAAESPSPLSGSGPASVDWVADLPSGRTPKKSHFSLSSTASSSNGGHSLSPAEKKKIKSYTFPRTDRGSRRDSTAGGKWKKAVGFDWKKGKKTEGEKRRESMKKKIVIVGAVEQPF